jgi:predicted Fe-Mo cluster-binding NifX family protein
MKVVVSSLGKGLESEVDSRFGRCPYFVVVNVDKGEIKSHEAIENTSVRQTIAAGINAAELVARMKPDAIITQNIGPRAFVVFEQLGIEIYQATGKIGHVVKEMAEGKLERIHSATGPGHSGMPGFGRRPRQ